MYTSLINYLKHDSEEMNLGSNSTKKLAHEVMIAQGHIRRQTAIIVEK